MKGNKVDIRSEAFPSVKIYIIAITECSLLGGYELL